jgi:hypothetical protein
MDDIYSPEFACQLPIPGSDKQVTSIDTWSEDMYFYIELNNVWGEESLCMTNFQTFELRFEDAEVCYSQIEAKCAAMGTPIDVNVDDDYAIYFNVYYGGENGGW